MKGFVLNLILIFGNFLYNDFIWYLLFGFVGSWGFIKMKILVKKKFYMKKINILCCIEGIVFRFL